MNGSQNPHRVNNFYGYGFMDLINILSFLIDLENLQLNASTQDLSEESNRIIEEIHAYFKKENEHLNEQDKRLDRLERLIMSHYDTQHSRKEKK